MRQAGIGQPAGGARILVVDDDPIFAALMEQFLIQHGATGVAIACDGQNALELLVADPVSFDGIVLDLAMPNLDGVRFLRSIAELAFVGRIAIVSGEIAPIRDSARKLAGLLGLACSATFGKPADFDAIARHMVASQPAAPAPMPEPVDAEEINAGLRRSRLSAYYQPRIDLASGKVTGAEALARMSDSTGSMIDAAQMINLAERNGAINDITWRMVEIIAQDAASLQRELGRPLVISFNISASILTNENFAQALGEIVRQSGLAPENFVVEITESLLPTDHARSLESLTLLRMQGFGLAIDDFGTGHSNIEKLQMFPFSELKIDRSFLSAAARDGFALACVEASVALARKLSLVVVGEGVETEKDLALARNCGIDLAQGYLFSRPLPFADFLEFVERHEQRDQHWRQAS